MLRRDKTSDVQQSTTDEEAATDRDTIWISLLAVIFVVPDFGSTKHQSIFTMAMQSAWGSYFDLVSA